VALLSFIACIGFSCSKSTRQDDGISWVLIEPGTFLRDGEAVEVFDAFYLGAYEITQKQWHEVMTGERYEGEDGQIPMQGVTRDNAMLFCKTLGEKTGNSYRLPYRDEWEYACRAGTATQYYWGEEFDEDYAWLRVRPAKLPRHPQPVGLKIPNAMGLYDMLGNVSELCMAEDVDGRGGGRTERSMGGTVHATAERCGCSLQEYEELNLNVMHRGLRLVREIE
jgi:formylglycine-generating enzyme required for sulfatase activity